MGCSTLKVQLGNQPAGTNAQHVLMFGDCRDAAHALPGICQSPSLSACSAPGALIETLESKGVLHQLKACACDSSPSKCA